MNQKDSFIYNERLIARRSIAVAIPCYNEAITIAKVVRDFKTVLPHASIHVFDNNSTDGSAKLAEDAGAIVHTVHLQGKGHVMRDIFETINADAIIVVDGDDTYFPEDVTKLLIPVLKGEADMVVGNRLWSATDESLRRLHRFGNHMIVDFINRMFGTSYQDILSGYRVISRRFIDTVPLLKGGFETETEITLQALESGFRVMELPISYRSRPAGSQSKLRSFRDGYRIMLTALMLLRDHQPMRLFGFVGAMSLLIVFVAGILRILDYFGIVNLSTALLTGIMLLLAPIGTISFGIGSMLSAINTRFREIRQIITRNRKIGSGTD